VKKKPRSAGKTPAPPSLLAAALRAQADGVLIADASTPARGLRILFVNDSFCAMTGHRAAVLLGERHDVFHADRSDFAKLRAWLRRRPPTTPFSGEGYLIRRDGESFYASWTLSPIVNRRQRVTHLVAAYRDTTEKRRLQEALVHSQRLDAVGRLAGGVAHDFNNLLSVINGYCEMLAAQVADRPRALREVTEIHKAGLRAATLTRQLLAFGRRQPMDAHVISFNRVVQENAEIMRRLIGDAGRLELELAADAGNVRADPTQFQQVLLNLVINARDALRDNGCITVATGNREIKPGHNRRVTDIPPGRYVCLAVTDNGTGMDAETHKHLFEPFFTTKPEGKGTGLGLALVYGVVQQSDGFITVRSALLAGSTFEILLPEVREPADAADSPAPIPPLPATRGHETLLLVEDDEVVRKMVAGMLTADGYRVLAARDPAEAKPLALRSERPVQLVISPLKNGGEELARELQARIPALRMLCIGDFDAPASVDWLEAQHQAPLAKPFALSEILHSVRSLLDA